MFNVIRKSNSSVVKSFETETEAQDYLKNLGPQRNFLKIVEDKSTEKKVRSELSKSILEILENSNEPMSCTQIHTALTSNGMNISMKKVCDYVWSICYRQKKLTQPKKGVYQSLSK